MNYFTLTECFLLMLKTLIQHISFIPPIIQTVGDLSKTFQINCYGSWHHQNLWPTCPTHGHWHTVLLSRCSLDGQRGCFCLAEALCWHTVILNVKEAKPTAARGSKPAGPVLLMSLLRSRKHHSTRRVVGPCGTTHLAFLSWSSMSLTGLLPETDLSCHS